VQGLVAQGVRPAEGASGTTIVAEQQTLPLPRWREGGTPYDPNQSLQPYALTSPKLRDLPAAGLVASPPEYSPVRGVLFSFAGYTSVVRDLVVALTQPPRYDEIAYVVVQNRAKQAQAAANFEAGGADMSKVEFIIEPGNSVWLRDYGPHFIWQNGALAIVDSHYYPSRPLDNFIPTLLGDDHFIMPTYDMGLYYSGGNFQPGPNRSGFVTSLINLDNPSSEGFDAGFIAELYATYLGIDALHIMPQLPFSVDGTGHIDMWMYIVDEDTVIISKFKRESNPTAIAITDNAVPYMESLGFEVFRTPAWNVGYTHFTYTNAFRVNNRIFVSTYGEGNPSYQDEDADALATWQAAAGRRVELVPINSYSIIPAAGALHCIVMQVPRYTNPAPAVHVVSPDGGELLLSGTTQTIAWVATDTDNVAIPQIDLYYSTDGGNTYTSITTTTDTGFYDWTVPEVVTDQAKIKVVATSVDSDQGEGVSTAVFQIAPGWQTIYDFATGADKFGFGHQTPTWNRFIDGNRMPVTAGIDTLVRDAYADLASSDATGGDWDSDRYISPDPSFSYESTHVFEFTIDEDLAEIADIEILWEGYADQCTQVELYVWDNVEEQWSDGGGYYGQNRFLDNWAGNRDGFLKGNIRSDFGRYIDESGQMTLLLYAERDQDQSFHDYLVVTVSTLEPTLRDLAMGRNNQDLQN
jgi:agmatine/peptidylarginine deiminase